MSKESHLLVHRRELNDSRRVRGDLRVRLEHRRRFCSALIPCDTADEEADVRVVRHRCRSFAPSFSTPTLYRKRTWEGVYFYFPCCSIPIPRRYPHLTDTRMSRAAKFVPGKNKIPLNIMQRSDQQVGLNVDTRREHYTDH